MSLPSPFGRYWLEEKIATGGMAEIFRAKLLGVEGFEKRVVIKRILPFWSERRDFISMLVDEAKVLVHLNHPNIVQVYELGRVGPTYFIAMEYVEGRDLRHLAERLKDAHREFPQDMALSIVIHSLKGLQYAHERTLHDKGALGIVHRDISPQNILLGLGGEVKVSDFGIAKAVTQTHETETGVLKGKYAYMSPEQSLGRALDRRSDLFSMGIVLYEMVMGHRLFAGASDLETLEKVRKAEIPWSEESTEKLLPGLREVLSKSLVREREGRFQSAGEFAEALEFCLSQGRPVGADKLAKFFQGVFGDELAKFKIPVLPASPPGTSRRTLVTAGEGQETVSLVGVPEEAPSTAPRVRVADRKLKFLPWALGLLWLAMGLGMAWWLIPQFRQKPEAPGGVSEKVPVLPASVPAPSPAAVPAPPVAGIPPETAATPAVPNLKVAPDPVDVKKVAPPQKTAVQSGSLRINAVPWGRVTVPGLIGGQETPVMKTNIKVGAYSVVVANPSFGKTVSTRVHIRPGATTVCTADFEGNARIRCH